jgi:hypothetical protein
LLLVVIVGCLLVASKFYKHRISFQIVIPMAIGSQLSINQVLLVFHFPHPIPDGSNPDTDQYPTQHSRIKYWTQFRRHIFGIKPWVAAITGM